MGCDGGTIPKRNEIVKNKRKDEARDKDADLLAKWQYCSLSGLKLEKPIVACKVGKLYNKTEVIKHLLERSAANKSKSSGGSSSKLEDDPIYWIRNMSDIRELKLKEKDSTKAATGSSSTRADQQSLEFVCPISGLEVGGKYKFYYLFTCGCVFSERALRQVPNEKQCILCYKTYDPENDLIVINGDTEETSVLRKNLLAKLEASIAAKKASKKRALDEGSSSSKHAKKRIASH